jgi:hypothetical protein
MRTLTRSFGGSTGLTLSEALVAASILAVVLLSSYALIQHDTQVSRSSLGIAVVESRAQAMLHGLERELADARGANPVAHLVQSASAAAVNHVEVDSTLGFPPSGLILLSRGGNQVERVRYSGITADRFTGLERGAMGTGAHGHAQGVEALWCGLAEPIELQTNPPASLWDGRARIGGRTVFYRGDGAGFSYRTPTDPTGGTDYIEGAELRWGSTVRGAQLLDGWSAVVFEPKDVHDEAVGGQDLNRDGDRTDVYDVGQLRRRTWSTNAPDAPGDDLGLGPTCVLQERNRWGSDLDGDGFQDPLFLWDAERRELSIRLFLLGAGAEQQPIVRRVETVVFLRNDAQG